MLKELTKNEYRTYLEKKSPNSKVSRNIARAFAIGGIICSVGQIFANYAQMKGYNQDTVSGITSLIMIFLGALLTGLNMYDELGRYGGAGSIVPITGFANSIVSPAMEFKTEGYVMGVGAKMFSIAGPVIVYGVSASVILGILYFITK